MAGLLTPRISPPGHRPEMAGQGQMHCHTRGPAEDPLQLGKSHRNPTPPAEKQDTCPGTGDLKGFTHKIQG